VFARVITESERASRFAEAGVMERCQENSRASGRPLLVLNDDFATCESRNIIAFADCARTIGFHCIGVSFELGHPCGWLCDPETPSEIYNPRHNMLRQLRPFFR